MDLFKTFVNSLVRLRPRQGKLMLDSSPKTVPTRLADRAGAPYPKDYQLSETTLGSIRGRGAHVRSVESRFAALVRIKF
jgi:hypothetical protein